MFLGHRQVKLSFCLFSPPFIYTHFFFSFASVAAGYLVDAKAASASLVRRIATGGCDNLVKIWRFDDADQAWHCEHQLAHHKDWVRDVAFAPNVGLPGQTLASCSQDGGVVVWTLAAGSAAWLPGVVHKFADVVWRVSWSLTGSILAVSGGDNEVSMWKEAASGEAKSWQMVSKVDAQSSATATSIAPPLAANGSAPTATVAQ